MIRTTLLGILGLIAASCSFTGLAHAQASRTWVSGVGSDSNPCSRTAPCATFAGAYAQTSVGGEIDVLDPGGYGALTITHSISIYNDGAGEAGVLVSGTNGIVIAAGATDIVNLRGLTFNGLGSSLNGILISGAGRVSIQDCVIQKFGNGSSGLAGINVAPSSGSVQVGILNTTIINSSTNALGVLIKPTGGATVNATIDHSHIDMNSSEGVKANGAGGGPVNLAISNSSISLNGDFGVIGTSGASGNVTVALTNDVIASNVTSGVQSNKTNGGTPTVTVGSSMLSNNGTATTITAAGTLLSFGNNQITGPAGSGFSGTVGLQ